MAARRPPRSRSSTPPGAPGRLDPDQPQTYTQFLAKLAESLGLIKRRQPPPLVPNRVPRPGTAGRAAERTQGPGSATARAGSPGASAPVRRSRVRAWQVAILVALLLVTLFLPDLIGLTATFTVMGGGFLVLLVVLTVVRRRREVPSAPEEDLDRFDTVPDPATAGAVKDQPKRPST